MASVSNTNVAYETIVDEESGSLGPARLIVGDSTRKNGYASCCRVSGCFLLICLVVSVMYLVCFPGDANILDDQIRETSPRRLHPGTANIFDDQVLEESPFFEEIKEFALANCKDYYASGRSGSKFVPQFVAEDGKCFSHVVSGDVLPDYMKLMVGGDANPCFLELAYDVAKNGETCYADIRNEHIPLLLLIDNNPETRLNLTNNYIREIVPDVRGRSVIYIGIVDFWFHLKEFHKLPFSGENRSRYFSFVFAHTAQFSFEVVFGGGSGVNAWLKAAAQFSKTKTFQQLKKDFMECKSNMTA